MFTRFLAETVRFELTEGCPSAVFKTAGLNHSPTSPGGLNSSLSRQLSACHAVQ